MILEMPRSYLPFEQYKAIDAISHSDLRLANRSLRHYQLGLRVEATPSMILGSATHCYVLEPERFDSEYYIIPVCDRRTKEGKSTFERHQELAGNRSLLPESEMVKIAGMRKELEATRTWQMLKDNVWTVECTIQWKHEATALRCKGRPDAISGDTEKNRTLIEYKTTSRASSWNFQKSIVEYGYHTQLAYYGEGLRKHGFEPAHCIIIAQETEFPYLVAFYRLNNEALKLGHDQNETTLKRIKYALESGYYEGYPDMLLDIDLPKYMYDSTL
jgi:hypothetical protein